MTGITLAEALEREHREIDGGIEEYAAAEGNADPAPLLRAMAGLRRHIYLEEEFLFPPLKEAGMVMPIFVMLREHGQLWDAMDELDALLAGDGDPEMLRHACRELLSTLDAHNSKEEPIIYPQADAVLAPDAAARLHDFLRSGEMPPGWRCEKAA